MSAVVDCALPLWGLSGARYGLVAARENAVYQVMHNGAEYALRLHRPGYRSDAELRSELNWMKIAARAGLSVPAPSASTRGAFLHEVQGVQVDVLAWLDGAPLAECLGTLRPQQRADLFAKLGQAMARLHGASDAATLPAGFTRCRWDTEGLLGEAPLWGRFWDNPALSAAQRGTLRAFRAHAREVLHTQGGALDFGLIHADLVPNNVIVQGREIALIDFDDGGYGYRLFEIATGLLKVSDRPEFAALRAALLAGYRSERPLDTAHLGLFIALRAASYVGWNISRMSEPGGTDRNARFIAAALACAQAALDAARSGRG